MQKALQNLQVHGLECLSCAQDYLKINTLHTVHMTLMGSVGSFQWEQFQVKYSSYGTFLNLLMNNIDKGKEKEGAVYSQECSRPASHHCSQSAAARGARSQCCGFHGIPCSWMYLKEIPTAKPLSDVRIKPSASLDGVSSSVRTKSNQSALDFQAGSILKYIPACKHHCSSFTQGKLESLK